jgi:outer membrane cobalamin receptor
VVEKVTSESPASITILETPRLREIPGVNLDDRLRQVPGFSLFRRSSSLVANPTTQGISLRGIGSTGASRTLVLWDGIPINDPFGGWIYWTRISPEEVDRIEMSRGASTSVFGDRALGGAIALFGREPAASRIGASYEGGNKSSHQVGANASHLFGGGAWGVAGTGRAFTTDGYFIVPESIRGPVDQRANVRFAAGDARLDYLGASQRFFLKSDILVEERGNGTVEQNNSTSLGSIAARYLLDRQDQSFSVLGFHTREEFRATFSAIATDRVTERITFRQSVPSEAVGGAALWSLRKRPVNLMAGADVFRVEGYSRDYLVPSGLRLGGGTLLQHGVFVQSDISAGPAKFFLGARHHVAGEDSNFFSPSAGFVVGRRWIRARGSVYRSFRAPTLNELYREFRAGNAVTLPNAGLLPEKVFGAETGIDLIGENARARFTFFRNDLTDLITNVTLSVTPTLITRQRRNAASALNRGMEAELFGRWRFLHGEVAYLFADSRFATGERVPQVPRHQGSAQLTAEYGKTLLSGGVRSYGLQYEDERNLFALPGFAVVQLMVRHRLTNQFSALAAFENLLDREFLTGYSPTPTIGAPRLWRVGLRWDGNW